MAAIAATSLLLAACDSGNSTGPDASDVVQDVASADSGGIAPSEVSFLPTTPPTLTGASLRGWSDDVCTVQPSGAFNCPTVSAAFDCVSVIDLGRIGAWLDPDIDPLLCRACPPNGTYPCDCPDGVNYHQAGFGGRVCDYIVLPTLSNPETLRTPADLASRYGPVASEHAALAFAQLVTYRAQHLFSRDEFLAAANASHGNTYESLCAPGGIEGSKVVTDGQDFIVSTFLIPDMNGCTNVSLESASVRVTSAGVVTLIESKPVCWASIACYD